MRIKWLLLPFLILPPLSPFAQERMSLTVAAAADLYLAFREIGEAFEKEEGVKVVFSFQSTGILAHQVEYGAPFDILFAADIKSLNRLKERGRIIPQSLQLYARGRLVLATSKRYPFKALELKDLLKDEFQRVAIADPTHAPYGIAAREALKSVGLWDRLRPKLVYGENIRQALQFVESGDAQAGIISLSLANSPKISWVLIDDRLHRPIEQAVAVVAGTRLEREAKRFISFVTGPVGRLIMKRYGFLIPGEF